jgi:very-short-patch-repair endonuclease
VDCYCPALQLAIEVDGPIHDERSVDDERRTWELARLGVAVVRVGNELVLTALSKALQQIVLACHERAGV